MKKRETELAVKELNGKTLVEQYRELRVVVMSSGVPLVERALIAHWQPCGGNRGIECIHIRRTEMMPLPYSFQNSLRLTLTADERGQALHRHLFHCLLLCGSNPRQASRDIVRNLNG